MSKKTFKKDVETVKSTIEVDVDQPVTKVSDRVKEMKKRTRY